MTLYFFYFLSSLAVLSALMVVFSKNPIYSVLYLIITFFALAGLYIILKAEFLAAVHIIVYAGAIMVLFLYVIMMLNLNQDTESDKTSILKFAAVISSGILMVILVGSMKGAELIVRQKQTSENIGLVKNLGKLLFNEFLLPFELTSVLLLVAIVGAVMLGKGVK